MIIIAKRLCFQDPDLNFQALLFFIQVFFETLFDQNSVKLGAG